MPSTLELQARVDRGLKALDERMPGWEKKVKLESLDLTSGDRCIIGQVYHHKKRGTGLCGYSIGIIDLFGREHHYTAAKHGFFTQSNDERIYARLERLWRDALAARITHAQKDTDLALSGD